MIEVKELNTDTKVDNTDCYHCGDLCPNSEIKIREKIFCCPGCKLVFEILEDNDLCTYYSIDEKPGISPKESGIEKKFAYLDDTNIKNRLLDFKDEGFCRVTLFIPAMHCSSCVWLLESLYRLNPGIKDSKVNFLKKELSINFDESITSFRAVVELLASIGYEPQITLENVEEKLQQQSNKDLYLKIGVAGFCFSNIMLFSFPEYLSFGEGVGPTFEKFFGYLNIIVALPVLVYSSSDYFRSALNGWKQKMVNMDVPISIGILSLFFRSLYDIISGAGVGFMDSFTGLVFLLLIGKLFEKKTYDTLSFERDYKSYFPISITIKNKESEQTIPLERLKIGDRIVIRNEELIPADSIMINGDAFIDYSFVTGESTPVKKVSGEMIYAGGKQIGSAIELDVIKNVSQSYLTQLWNDEAFKKVQSSRITTLANSVSKYFTISVLSLATLAALYWLFIEPSLAMNAFTAVLIIACPCGLALSTPFTLGNTLRIFGKNKFYLKNTSVIESLAKIDSVVFDKTGTITRSTVSKVAFISSNPDRLELTDSEKEIIASVTRQSTHPLSQQIFAFLSDSNYQLVKEYQEYPGKGIEGVVSGKKIKLGSPEFVNQIYNHTEEDLASQVYINIDGNHRGHFRIVNDYRPGLGETIRGLIKSFKVFLLTGDNDREKPNLLKYFSDKTQLYFRQNPFDKLNFIKKIQSEGKHVLMVGDGLNDAGALKQSDVGVSITDDINTFTPASDAILDGQQFQKLSEFIKFAKWSMKIIIISFVISFLYNLVGLSFAIQGTLSPLIAAILMPISSISVILFTTGTTTFLARRKGILK